MSLPLWFFYLIIDLIKYMGGGRTFPPLRIGHYGAHVPNMLFLCWECLFHSLRGNYHAIVGWTNNGRLHSHKGIHPGKHCLHSLQLPKHQFWKGKLTSKNPNLISPEESTSTKDEAPSATSNPSLIWSNQHKSQLVFPTIHHPLDIIKDRQRGHFIQLVGLERKYFWVTLLNWHMMT